MIYKQLDTKSDLFQVIYRAFLKRKPDIERFIHEAGMVGQTERPFPVKGALACAVYDHEKETFTYLRVAIEGDKELEWYEAALPTPLH